MPPAVFEPTISAEERKQTYALTRAVSRTGVVLVYMEYFFFKLSCLCIYDA